MITKILVGGWVALGAFGLSACALAPAAPVHHITSNQTYYNCPTDGTVYGFGSCVLPDGVIPAADSFHVQPDAPTKVCDYNGTLFECPGSYTVPDSTP